MYNVWNKVLILSYKARLNSNYLALCVNSNFIQSTNLQNRTTKKFHLFPLLSLSFSGAEMWDINHAKCRVLYSADKRSLILHFRWRLPTTVPYSPAWEPYPQGVAYLDESIIHCDFPMIELTNKIWFHHGGLPVKPELRW